MNMALDAAAPEFGALVYTVVNRVATAHKKRKELRETLDPGGAPFCAVRADPAHGRSPPVVIARVPACGAVAP
ncbi:MAG: hypothetical protein IPK82_33865 [Polyangiaceae bacterium]|nr:hypothetical protein [Polyangiaceae bacterium]